MQVTISTTSDNRGGDLASLRDWLVTAEPAGWTVMPERAATDTLGFGTDILLTIAAIDQLADLHDRVAAWFRTRHDAKDSITLTVTIDPPGTSKPRRDDDDQEA